MPIESAVRELLKDYPVIGDEISKVIGNTITYKSGIQVKVENDGTYNPGDKVLWVATGLDLNTNEVYIQIAHSNSSIIENDLTSVIKNEGRYIKLKRLLKMNK